MEKVKNTYGYTPSEYKKFKKYAWLMLLSFGLTYLFFYNGRQNINLVKTMMEAEFGGDKISIVTSCLFWCYAFGQLISGRLGAYFGYKKFMIFGVVSSAILNVLISFQHSVGVIAVLWGLNGFCQSTVWANGLGVLNKWWPKEKRGFASGLATAFTGTAQVVTYLTINLCLFLNPEWTWRAAFRYPMIPMVLVLVAFILFFKTKPEDIGLKAFEEEKSELDKQEAAVADAIAKKGYFYPYKLLFSQPKVILFCVISAIAGIGRYGLLEYMPKYFEKVMGLEVKNAIFSSIVLPIGHACAMFLFPFITDKVFKGKREPMLIIASIITFCGMISFAFIDKDMPNASMIATTLLFIVGVSGMVTGVIWAIAGDIGGRALSSTLVGVLDWAVYMGAAVQSIGFNFLINKFGWPSLFITLGCLYIIMLVLTLCASKIKNKELVTVSEENGTVEL